MRSRTGPSWKKKSLLKKIEVFKYKDKCGFRMFLGSNERFIIDKIHTPYTDSLLRVIDRRKTYRPKNGIIMFSNSGFQSFENIPQFMDLLINNFHEPVNKTHEVISKIEKRKYNIYD